MLSIKRAPHVRYIHIDPSLEVYVYIMFLVSMPLSSWLKESQLVIARVPTKISEPERDAYCVCTGDEHIFYVFGTF